MWRVAPQSKREIDLPGSGEPASSLWWTGLTRARYLRAAVGRHGAG